jgi:TM2 domain-containing membrane protein YozV
MKCLNHIDRDAETVCIACGISICPDCAVELNGETYCKKCIAEKTNKTLDKPKSPGLAAFLSFILAGAGQVYNGQIGKGILIFLTSWLIIPWVIGMFDAYNVAKKIRDGEIEDKGTSGCGVAALGGCAVVLVGFMVLGLLAAIAIPNFIKAKDAAMGASNNSITIENIERTEPIDPEDPTGYVHDFAGFLSLEDKETLKTQCLNIKLDYGVSVALVITKDPSNQGFDTRAEQLFQQWTGSMGGSGKDILIYFSLADGRVTVQMSNDMLTYMTKEFAGHLVNNIIIPEVESGARGKACIDTLTAIQKECKAANMEM